MELKDIKEMLEGIRDETKKTMSNLKEAVEQQEEEIKELGQAREETGEKVANLTEKLEDLQGRITEVEKEANRKFGMPGGDGDSTKTLGQRFVESDAYKNYDPEAGGDSNKFVTEQSAANFFEKAVLGDALNDIPGYLYQATRLDGIITPPQREDRIRDLLNVVPVTTGAIEYVRETGFTNAASGVEENTAKPESDLSYELISDQVKTIAHWIPTSRQAVSDVPQIQNAIDTRLIYGLQTEEDEQILYGDGTGGNLEGILQDADIQTYNWSDGESGDTQLDAIRRAMTKAMLADYPIDGLVINTNDWEDIELLKGNDGHYIWVTVGDSENRQLWRANAVITNALQEGDFLTGAFGMGAELYDRQQAGIRVSESHADFFTKNMLAILAEERLGLALLRPEAFVHGQFDAEPTA